jgi:hypothetical protein
MKIFFKLLINYNTYVQLKLKSANTRYNNIFHTFFIGLDNIKTIFI